MDAMMDGSARSSAQRLMRSGYDDIVIFSGYSYDTALIGVTTDDRAVYDFDKMVAWLMQEEGWSQEEAVEWIEYNTIRALFPRRTDHHIQTGVNAA